ITSMSDFSLQSVRDWCLGIGWECRIDLRSTQEVECHVECFVVLGLWRDIRLRAGLFLAFVALEMTAQRRLAFRIGLGLEVLCTVLQNPAIGRNPLRLDGTAGRREVARRGQPQGSVAGPQWNNGLHRALAE